MERFFLRKIESLEKEKGLEKTSLAIGSGRNREGKFGKKHEVGQIIGIKSFSFWILEVLAGALVVSRFL